jgi:pectin methylesterase-like acyl-CoA thioesterase
MKISDLKESCEIFIRNGFSDTFIEASHDVIFGPSLETIDRCDIRSNGDMKRLEELGWHRDEYSECLMCYV